MDRLPRPQRARQALARALRAAPQGLCCGASGSAFLCCMWFSLSPVLVIISSEHPCNARLASCSLCGVAPLKTSNSAHDMDKQQKSA